MQFLLNRFNEKFKQNTAITVRFFNEEPLTVKQIRYNQGGTACYCMEGQNKAKQKVQNKWTTIECKEDCEYRLKKGNGKPMCNEEGTLKFMLPDICTDKIWYMKITGHTSIQTLKNYINFQKSLGNSLVGDYVIFLKEVEHTNSEGKKFKNKVLDIIRKEDFISNNQTAEQNQILPQNQTEISTDEGKNVEKTAKIPETVASNNTNQTNVTEIKVESNAQNIESTEKKTTRKTTKAKKEELKEVEKTTKTQDDENIEDKFDKYYVLVETKTKKLMKEGKLLDYLFATFINTQDKTVEVIIPPQLAEELKQCNLGTEVLLDLQTKGDKTFTNTIQYLNKCIKNVAA